MRLQHITFTGIDAKTDIKALKDIQSEFPIAEFGVLISKHWYENGNRYMNPGLMQNLKGLDLNLSAHLCGSIAKEVYAGCIEPAVAASGYTLDSGLFQRMQLNVAPYDDMYMSAGTLRKSQRVFDPPKEVIIQCKSASILSSKAYLAFEKVNPDYKVTKLIDPSGGQGKDEGLDIIATYEKTGYAGGVNASNVEEKLSKLMEQYTVGNFWIDMESGVRTDDWFDLDKVIKVLEICNQIVPIKNIKK